MRLIIYTQLRENYGAHDWDGEGECPQYWKFKGGNEYAVEGVDECDMIDVYVERSKPLVESCSHYYTEHVVGYTLIEDNALTDFEQSQKTYDGVVTYPAVNITDKVLLNNNANALA